MAVGKFHLPILSGSSSGGNLTPEPYVRPVDWLSIDSLVNSGDQKVVILAAVFEESNFVAVLILPVVYELVPSVVLPK